MRFMPYCTGHYRHDAALRRAAELRREPGVLAARVGATMREDGIKYSKIYVAKACDNR